MSQSNRIFPYLDTMIMSQYLGRGVTSRGRMSIDGNMKTHVAEHPYLRDENDVAAEIVGFLQQFLEVFSELQGKNFYLSGESVSVSSLALATVDDC